MQNLSSLVEGGIRRYGRFADRPASVNPLDESSGTPRALRRLRLKEWIGFTLVHPGLFSSLIMQDANYLASSEIYAYDRARRALHQHAANARGGSLRLPQDLPGASPAFSKPGYLLRYDFSPVPGRHRLRIDIAATARAPAFAGDLELHADQASLPLSVSSRLPGGKMYTHKALFPAEGTLRVGDAEFVFDPSRDLAILDEHKSFLPYRTTWLWGTFGTHAAGGPVGANFIARPEVPGQQEESCLWTPGACEPLADIAFERREPADPLSSWRVTSRDGRLNVTFEPEGRKDVRHQLGVFAIDYFQLFGHYRGTAGSHWLDGAHGVCESFRARLLHVHLGFAVGAVGLDGLQLVPAGVLLDGFGVPGFEQVDEAGVLCRRGLDALRQVGEHRGPDPVQAQVGRLEQFEQVGVGAAGHDRGVQAAVQLAEPQDVAGLGDLIHLGGHLPQPGHVRDAQVPARVGGGGAFQDRERHHLLLPHGVVHGRDDRANVGTEPHPALGLEPPQCLPHRDRADTQLTGERVDVQPRLGRMRAGVDPVPENRIGPLLLVHSTRAYADLLWLHHYCVGFSATQWFTHSPRPST